MNNKLLLSGVVLGILASACWTAARAHSPRSLWHRRYGHGSSSDESAARGRGQQPPPPMAQSRMPSWQAARTEARQTGA